MERLKIIILNGSPKGETSVSVQYMRYLELRFPQHNYEFINAAQNCTKYEKNRAAFETVMDKIDNSDLVLWAFPLYYMLVCSQYKRFIELVFEREKTGTFKGKYTAALSTSIHFFDHTAINYIQAVCDDLGMNFLEGITAKMDDLRNEDFRTGFDKLFSGWAQSVRTGRPVSRGFAPVTNETFSFVPENTNSIVQQPGPQKVCIVGDLEHKDSNVRKMAALAAGIKPGAETIDLGSLKFGPCAGCLKCGFDNICAYEGKDNLINLHRNTILKADIIIFTGAIHDRYLSSVWQRYLERTFNYTHQPRLVGKQIGFIISGPLAQNHNIREILQGYAETMGGNLLGFVTDEPADNSLVSRSIEHLMHQAHDWNKAGVRKPKSFLGIGGMKIFRDDIYSHLRFVFQADHEFYKQQGLYDFPQKRFIMAMAISAGMLLTKIPPLRKKIRQQLRQGMINPYKKLFSKILPAGVK